MAGPTDTLEPSDITTKKDERQTRKVEAFKEAVGLLVHHSLLIEHEEVTVPAIATALLHMCEADVKKPLLITLVKAAALLLKTTDLIHESEAVADAILDRVNEPIHLLAQSPNDIVVTLEETEELHQARAKEMMEKIEAMEKRNLEILDKCQTYFTKMETSLDKQANATNRQDPPNSDQNSPPAATGTQHHHHPRTYADAATPGTLEQADPATQRILTRDRFQTRTLVIQPIREAAIDSLHKLDDEIIIKKAQMAITLMGVEFTDKPDKIEFLSFQRSRNGAIVYELASAQEAEWIKKPAVVTKFLECYGMQAQQRASGYQVVVEFVPVQFDPHSIAALTNFENRNKLGPGELLAARYIKPIERRTTGQRLVHVVMTLRTKQAANSLITEGPLTEFKRTTAHKLEMEVERCMRCQGIDSGHRAANCPHEEVCATCAQAHKTRDCPNKESSNYKCVNCAENGHAAWDRNCPTFKRKQWLKDQANPESAFRLYVTDDPRTWERKDGKQTNENTQQINSRSRTRVRGTIPQQQQTTSRPPPQPREQRPRGRSANPRNNFVTAQDLHQNDNQYSQIVECIWQQNLNKSSTAQAKFINNLGDYHDIVCIQELWIDFLGNTRATSNWIVIYPTPREKDRKKTRSVILVNKNIHSFQWQQIDVPSHDITAIELTNSDSALQIYNIYNNCDTDHSTDTLEAHLNSRNNHINNCDPGKEQYMLWLGDFNRHHPLWDEARNKHLFTSANLDAAQTLLNLLSDYDMQMTLPQGLPTLVANATGNLTRPDNVFCSADLLQAVITCQPRQEDRLPLTDHFPILTYIDFKLLQELDTSDRGKRYNYRQIDWTKYNKTLATKLSTLPAPDMLTTTESFDHLLQHVLETIIQTTAEIAPEYKPTPYTKRWWTKDLSIRRKVVQKLSKKAHCKRMLPYHPVHELHRCARNDYAQAIKEAKEQHWKEWLENATDNSIWTANRMVTKTSTDGGKERVPALRQTATNGTTTLVTSNSIKSRLLYNVFFPSQTVTPTNFSHIRYSCPKFKFQFIKSTQIARAVTKLSPFKAPGPDGIPNVVFKECLKALLPYLASLFRATFSLKYYPDEWKVYSTIVLRKPGKPDYTLPKAYRGIALLNTISKILSACVAEDLTYWTEKEHLLPDNHFGGRPGRTTTDALHIINSFIWHATRQGNVVVALFLDIKGAFPSVIVARLIHDMCMRGIPKTYTDWINRKLTGRNTRILFDDYISDPIQVINGVDQGCPLSTLLYQYYNAGLIELSSRLKNELATAYLDDVSYITIAKTFRQAYNKLRNMMMRPGGAEDWARTHHSEIEKDKLHVMGFTEQTEPNPTLETKTRPKTRPQFHYAGQSITPSESTKHLGLIMDQKLLYREHNAYALAKGTTWALQICRLAKPVYGMPPRFIRRLFISVAIPKMLYAADIFCAGKLHRLNAKSGIIAKMARVQRMAALQATGALRSTPNDWLNAHIDLLPFKFAIRKVCHAATIRIATLSASHPLHPIARNAASKFVKTHRSPLHHLMHVFQIKPLLTEKIEAVRHDPKISHPFEISIAQDKETAMDQQFIQDPNTTYIYTDGSGYQNKIGAAAVLFTNGKPTYTLQYQLGSTAEHTVYEGEAVALILALQIIRTRQLDGKVTILADNQAVIRATLLRKPVPGHYIIDHFIAEATRIKEHYTHMDLKLKIEWIPGHKGHPGNEAADKAAKQAAVGTNSARNVLPKLLQQSLPLSKSAIKQKYTAETKNTYNEEFKKSPRYARIFEIDPSVPSSNYRKNTEHLHRKNTSVLIQLRTGHVPLRAHLFRINKAESPTCLHCNEGPETVIHYLMRCKSFQVQRNPMVRALKRHAGSLRHILNNPKNLQHLFRYISETKRFYNTFGDLMI